ncbi:hypothetical protein CK203_013626 [Vitis vinifera]|uniref:Uncharacterized protein n=1 Tax=Vitis vinifera TaxID=29760 RepID=A0A438J959_VITVI|nr:hypothetical protein CK203_013626 [Vitis vinifera]
MVRRRTLASGMRLQRREARNKGFLADEWLMEEIPGTPILSPLRCAFGGDKSLLLLLSWGKGAVIELDESKGRSDGSGGFFMLEEGEAKGALKGRYCNSSIKLGKKGIVLRGLQEKKGRIGAIKSLVDEAKDSVVECKGGKRQGKRRVIKDVIKSQKVDLVCIQETKSRRCQMGWSKRLGVGKMFGMGVFKFPGDGWGGVGVLGITGSLWAHSKSGERGFLE